MQTTILNIAEIKDINDARGVQNMTQSYHFDVNAPEVSDKAFQLANILQITLVNLISY